MGSREKVGRLLIISIVLSLLWFAECESQTAEVDSPLSGGQIS